MTMASCSCSTKSIFISSRRRRCWNKIEGPIRLEFLRCSTHTFYPTICCYNPLYISQAGESQPTSSMNQPFVVYLPHIDELPASGPSYILRNPLVGQRLKGSLDYVHWVARANAASREVRDARRASHFEDERLCAVSEAYVEKVSASSTNK